MLCYVPDDFLLSLFSPFSPSLRLDTSFSPFSDTFLSSASEDGRILLWQIDESIFSGWGEEGWGIDSSIKGGKGEVEDMKSCGTLMAGGGRLV